MNVPINILIGNAISLVAGLFIILSMWVNDEKQAYRYQFWNAFILAISSVFFFSWSGVITMGIAAAKNAVVYKGKLTFKLTIFSCYFWLFSKYDGFCWTFTNYWNNPDYIM